MEKDKFFRKRESVPDIELISAEAQVGTEMKGWYDLQTGKIGLGCTERECPKVLFHEHMHKHLFENMGLEAGLFWDKIASEVEKFLYGSSLFGGDRPYALTLPEKRAESKKNIHQNLTEKGIIPEEHIITGKEYLQQRFFGLGISIYRDKKEECISKEVHSLTQQKKYREAAELSTEIIYNELLTKLPNTQIQMNKPVFGIYQGTIEPSALPFIKGNLWKHLESIKKFKEYSHQDSILVYEIVPDGFPAFEIELARNTNIITLQKKLLAVTDNKFGNFLTYIYEHNTVFILNVPEFDGLKKAEFLSYKPILEELCGNADVFYTHYQVV